MKSINGNNFFILISGTTYNDRNLKPFEKSLSNKNYNINYSLQNQIHKYCTISIFDICSKNSNLISVVYVGTGYPAPERI